MNSPEKLEVAEERLHALPVQVMSVGDDLILARGVTELRISGARATEIVPAVLEAASGAGITRSELLEKFAAPDRAMVGTLVDGLRSRSILVHAGEEPPSDRIESGLDIFYWHFGQSAQEAVGRMNEKRTVLLGVNAISRRMATSLHDLGVKNVLVVDFHNLRNLRFYDDDAALRAEEWPVATPTRYEEWTEDLDLDDIACLVATSDFGGAHLFREWNRFCIENPTRFLPVLLDRFIGTIGPIVIPGETACYECLRLRENANMDVADMERAAEFGAADRQAVTGFHPAMANVVAEMAAMELCKVLTGLPWRGNRIIEVNLLVPSLLSRKVLKLPLCPVCSPAVKTSGVYLDKDSFVPGHDLNFHESL